MPLSSKQMEYLALAWQCFETEPKINYAKFAEVAGLASANSARELMRVAKNKLKNEYGMLSAGMVNANAANAGGSPAKKATPSKRARKPELSSDGHGEENGDLDDEESPKKKGKASPKKVTVKAEPAVVEDEDPLFQ
ncbi:hypothetical protein LTR15_006119 [Elasticomyces elasticus]|nr:hypothetical protein LTR15_006119 [Elasticomyces elasticus]